jgi:hypothetical protein
MKSAGLGHQYMTVASLTDNMSSVSSGQVYDSKKEAWHMSHNAEFDDLKIVPTSSTDAVALRSTTNFDETTSLVPTVAILGQDINESNHSFAANYHERPDHSR